ncbi:HD domain-containing phosphohydrolase [Fuerstiella marisgermanici]|uniref:Cyclic di-GMP phosphodiesterase response regulator RpfG n=1 Tax=Fuerstiella marisgermanici TaxID=1891926 RepID=A0A1P8WCC0_9PLAN|nr:HD domain-containing phosphohydrolase [Fuerstiella marisgermanici]APZ91683.1 Cyclic di-GMP phosphodiesterase response regulator RpfG [Fuerstiella marisgermanici]
MTPSPQSPERSVLDEIRSTIASLDALRDGKKVPNYKAALASRPTDIEVVEQPVVAEDERPEQSIETVDPILHGVEAVINAAASAPVKRASADSANPANIDHADIDSADIDHADTSETSEGAESEAAVPNPTAATVHPESVALRHVNKNAKIMIVDDEPLNIMTFRQHLKQDGYHNFVTTERATEALVMIRQEQPDVLLLDIQMPEINGLDILRVMGLDPVSQHIPVLILTAETDPRVRKKALDLGASDFLSKPIDPSELLPRVRNAIILKKHYDMVANEAARLEQQVERRTRQLEATRQQLILSLARAAEHRDNDTGNHVIRVGRYTAIIASAMGYPERKLSMLEQAAQLHDVGKIGIPDSILFKPGKLDHDQYELMKHHCAIGKQIIEPISERDWEVLKTHTRKGESLLHVRSSPLLMLAARIAQTHHEKWDGSGYPLGLQGDDIPLEGRIVAVADVFDALSSARPYKKAFSREKCFAILEEGRGKHFDPRVLDAFFSKSGEIIETQLNLMDEEHRFVGADIVAGEDKAES